MIHKCFFCSFLPHKEFRFLSGILPFAFHLCGMALHHYIDGCSHVPIVQNHVKVRVDQDKDKKPKQPNNSSNNKRITNENHTSKFLVTMLLISLNAAPAIYTCIFHQRGTLDIMAYLSEQASQDPNSNILFLLPCHSTPYYRFSFSVWNLFLLIFIHQISNRHYHPEHISGNRSRLLSTSRHTSDHPCFYSLLL